MNPLQTITQLQPVASDTGAPAVSEKNDKTVESDCLHQKQNDKGFFKVFFF